MSGEKDPEVKAAEKKAAAYSTADKTVDYIVTAGKLSAVGMMAASNILSSMNSMIAKEAGEDLSKKCLQQSEDIEGQCAHNNTIKCKQHDDCKPALNPTCEKPPPASENEPDWDAIVAKNYATCISPLAKKIIKFSARGAKEKCHYAHQCKSMEEAGAAACEGYEKKHYDPKTKTYSEKMGDCTDPVEWDWVKDTIDLVALVASPPSLHSCVAPKLDKIINVVPVQYYLMKILTAMLGAMGNKFADIKNDQGKIIEQIACGGQLEQLFNKKSSHLGDPLNFDFEIPAIPYFKIPCTSPMDCTMRIIETLIIEVICLVFCFFIEKLLIWIAQGIYWIEKEVLDDLLDYNPAKNEIGTFLSDKTLNGPKLQKVNPINYIPSAAFEEAWTRKYVSTSISKEEARTLIEAYLTAAFDSSLEQRDIVMMLMGESTCATLKTLKGLGQAGELNLESEEAIVEFWEFLGGYLDMLAYLQDATDPKCPPEVCELTKDMTDNTLKAIKDLCDLLNPDFDILKHVDLQQVISATVGPQVRDGMGQHIGVLEMRIKEYLLLENKSEKEPYFKEEASKWRFLRQIHDYRVSGTKEEHGPPRTIERGYLNTHHFLSTHRAGHPADFYEESFDPSHHTPALMVYEPGHGFRQIYGAKYLDVWKEMNTENFVYGEISGPLKCQAVNRADAPKQLGFRSAYLGAGVGDNDFCRGYPAHKAYEQGEEWWQDVDGTFYIKYLLDLGAYEKDMKDGFWIHAQPTTSRFSYDPKTTAYSDNINSLHLEAAVWPGDGQTWLIAAKKKLIRDESGNILTAKDDPFIKVTPTKMSSDFWKFRPLKKIKKDGKDEYHIPYLVTNDAKDKRFEGKNFGAPFNTEVKKNCKDKDNILLCGAAHRENVPVEDVQGLGVPDLFYMARLRKAFLKGFLPFLDPIYYTVPGDEFGAKEKINFFTDGLFGFDKTEHSSNDYWHKQVSPQKMESRWNAQALADLTKIYEDNSKIDDTKFIGLMNRLQKRAINTYEVEKKTAPPPVEASFGTVDCISDYSCETGYGCMELSDGKKKCVAGHKSDSAWGPGEKPNGWICKVIGKSADCKSKNCQKPGWWSKLGFTDGVCVGKDCKECGLNGQYCGSNTDCKSKNCKEDPDSKGYWTCQPPDPGADIPKHSVEDGGKCTADDQCKGGKTYKCIGIIGGPGEQEQWGKCAGGFGGM